MNADFHCLFAYPGDNTFGKARPVGRKMAKVIYQLPFIDGGLNIDGNELAEEDARKLPLRNVFRDRFALERPSGQQMARLMGIRELAAPEELRSRGITKTPLWYYCLHEAEGCGGKLGPVGGTIVATTLLRLLYLDPERVLCSNHDFTPYQALGAETDGTYSMGHLLKFVELNRDAISNGDALATG